MLYKPATRLLDLHIVIPSKEPHTKKRQDATPTQKNIQAVKREKEKEKDDNDDEKGD